MCISLPFSLNLFVLLIKYIPKHPFFSIIVPIKFELSTQEVNLSLRFEVMSQDWESETVFFTGLVEYYLGDRRAYSMDRASLVVLMKFRHPKVRVNQQPGLDLRD